MLNAVTFDKEQYQVLKFVSLTQQQDSQQKKKLFQLTGFLVGILSVLFLIFVHGTNSMLSGFVEDMGGWGLWIPALLVGSCSAGCFIAPWIASVLDLEGSFNAIWASIVGMVFSVMAKVFCLLFVLFCFKQRELNSLSFSFLSLKDLLSFLGIGFFFAALPSATAWFLGWWSLALSQRIRDRF